MSFLRGAASALSPAVGMATGQGLGKVLPQISPLANGLGHLLHTDGGHVSDIAGRIGKGMNAVAEAGGATPGYQEAAPVDNHMQLLDPAILQRIMQQFGGAAARPQSAAQMTGYAQ